jgi:hypothetical protein
MFSLLPEVAISYEFSPRHFLFQAFAMRREWKDVKY